LLAVFADTSLKRLLLNRLESSLTRTIPGSLLLLGLLLDVGVREFVCILPLHHVTLVEYFK